LRRKEEIIPVEEEEKIEPSWMEKTCYELEELKGLTDDQKDRLYSIAGKLIFLTPEKIKKTYQEARKAAIGYEKSKDEAQAMKMRRIAIGLAIYEGNKKGAKENIEAYAKSTGNAQFGKEAIEFLDYLFLIQKRGYTPPGD